MAQPHFVLLYVDEPKASAAFYARLLDRQPLESSPNFVMFELSPDRFRLPSIARGQCAISESVLSDFKGLWRHSRVVPRS